MTNVLNIVTSFMEGCLLGSSILTVILILMLLAAWKAPAKVKECGLLALAFGFFYQLIGLLQILSYLQGTPDTANPVIFGGLKVNLIPALFGLAVYMLSLIIRLIQKPNL